MEQLHIDTKPLLRPAQLEAAHDERSSLEDKLRSPHIQDKKEVVKQLRRLDATLAAQTPKPFVGKELDAAVKMEADLRAEILVGMPSQEEMRKNPHGAVDKHMSWERRTKEKLLRWKNVQLRLNAGNPDGSVANFERYRPRESSLNMDGAQITGAQHFLPPVGVAPSVVLNERHMKLLEELDPELLDRLALLSNEQRREVKAVLESAQTDPDSGATEH